MSESTTTTAVSGTAAGPRGPAGSGAVPPRLRRQPWVVVAGVVLVLAGVVGGLMFWATLAPAQQVVVAARELDKHQVIGARDVRVVALDHDASVATIPGDSLSDVVGQRAATAIPAGGVLAPEQVADGVFPPEGLSVVPVVLTAEQSIGLGLEPGDDVRVVVSASTPQSDGEPGYTPAEVAAVHAGDSRAVVDVLVPHAEAVDLSAAMAAGRASIVHDATTASAATTSGSEPAPDMSFGGGR